MRGASPIVRRDVGCDRYFELHLPENCPIYPNPCSPRAGRLPTVAVGPQRQTTRPQFPKPRDNNMRTHARSHPCVLGGTSLFWRQVHGIHAPLVSTMGWAIHLSHIVRQWRARPLRVDQVLTGPMRPPEPRAGLAAKLKKRDHWGLGLSGKIKK